MKADIKAERDGKVRAAEEEFRAAMEHVEFVWRRFNGGLFPNLLLVSWHAARAGGVAAEPLPAESGNGHERGSLIAGIKSAIQALDQFTRDDVIEYLHAHQ